MLTCLARLLVVACLIIPAAAGAQPNTYTLNGFARQDNCNCYTLTQDAVFQNGSVWNNTKIDLNTGFDFIFNVNLGCRDGDGADGMAFILQPLSTNLGGTGGGMGFQGVTPSVGIALDTWQNGDFNDPWYDHISIQLNGVLNHSADIAGPVQASATAPNIEDCQWHTLRISWDPATRWIRAYFDGSLRVEAQVELISTVFGNDPMVYWGFGAATGGSTNKQQFCTALNPIFTTGLAGDATCVGNVVNFTNESASFAPIAEYYWDFGDGTTFTSSTPAPHMYDEPGLYNVKLAIRGFDGCRSDTLRKTIAIGDFPVAAFDAFDTCAGHIPTLTDQSDVEVGTVNYWNWTLNGEPESSSANPQFTDLAPGTYQVGLDVRSIYGCESSVATGSFIIKPTPVISAVAENGCVDLPVSFDGAQVDNATTISSWNWTLPAATLSGQSVEQRFTDAGNYSVTLQATATNGCVSLPAQSNFIISRAIANAGRDTVAIQNQPFQLQGSGGGIYSWSPSGVLNNAEIQAPIAVLADDQVFTLTVTNAEGCIDNDDVTITVFKGSQIYVPSGFTPNGDNLNDFIRPMYIGIRSLDFFQVYNRWGAPVFQTKDLGAGWDGRMNGQQQPTGTYIWVLRATDYVGKLYELKGTVTLIR